jgi:lipoate synthase
MSSGQAYEVRHPEMAMLTRSDILVGLGETEEGVPAEFKICSLLHVSSIEPLSSNGGAKRKRR